MCVMSRALWLICSGVLQKLQIANVQQPVHQNIEGRFRGEFRHANTCEDLWYELPVEGFNTREYSTKGIEVNDTNGVATNERHD